MVVTRFCVVSFFIPATMANDLRLWRIFYPRFYPLHLFSYLNSWERASIFPFECSVINKDTTGTIFITSLVWCGPWLGIEPETSRTRSQHNTTRQSRRRSLKLMDFQIETCNIDMHAPNLNFETQIRWHVILCLIDEWKFTLTNADDCPVFYIQHLSIFSRWKSMISWYTTPPHYWHHKLANQNTA